MLERIIEISTNEKDLVVDAISGSGSTLIAAKNLNRRFIGIDNNKEACAIARKRLKRGKSISKKVKIAITAYS